MNNKEKPAGEMLLDAIGDIKEKYIDESYNEALYNTVYDNALKMNTETRRSKKWMKYLSVAAVLLICVGVGARVILNDRFNINMSADEKASTSEGSLSDSSSMSGAEPENAYGDVESEASTEDAALETAESDGAFDMESSDFIKVDPDVDVDMSTDSDISDTYEELPQQGKPFVLTAGQWNDNKNWPFFTNLVNAGTISFPSYGIDPRNRIQVTVTDETGNTLKGEQVNLYSEGDELIWSAKSNSGGIAYLFYSESRIPGYVEVNGEREDVITGDMGYDGDNTDDQQGTVPVANESEEITIVTEAAAENSEELQVMFIVDTTGSMGDELSYLQMDFTLIAADTADENITYSVNFYRDHGDEYVTKTNGFMADVGFVQTLINTEYAAGGGDEPEAVADILEETISNNGEWKPNSNKVCFLIFDAPPHEGTEQQIIEAVRTAAEKGIHMVPVVASNADRNTELFGRALAICTDGEYVFLTDDSGVGLSHLEPIIGDYKVELLHDIIVRIINSYK